MPKAQILIEALPLNEPFPLEKGGIKIVLVRTAENVFAFEDVCPHAFWPLSAGFFHNGVLECPGHSWEFQVQTGKCEDSPGYCLTPVSTTIADGIVHMEWEEENTSLGRKRISRPQMQEAAANKDSAQAVSQLQD
jgi:nitrite reductase/ring-hydroxylating ferredoxin subunit